MLLVSVFSELTIWNWRTNWCGLLREGPLLHSRNYSTHRILCVGLKLRGFFSFCFGMPITLILVLLTFGLSHWWDFMSMASDIISDTIWLSQSFQPLLTQCCFILRCGCVMERYPLWVDSKTLHFDGFCFFVVISVAKRNFFDEGWRVHLSVVRTNLYR